MKKNYFSLLIVITLLFIASVSSAQVQWSQLGTTGFNAPIYFTTSDGSGNVYAGGNFTNTNNKHYVAMYNGTAWSEVGGLNGLSANGAINSICIDGSGNIYAAGSFTNLSSMYYVAKWDGTTWSELGGLNSLSANGAINSICVDVAGNVYAAGNFTNLSGNHYVAKWDGSSWIELGGVDNLAANGPIYTLRVDQQSNLYAAGDFTNINGYRYVAECGGYLGAGWGEVYSPINFMPLAADSTINGIDIKFNTLGDDVYVAGLFTNGSGKKYVAHFKNPTWDSIVSVNTSGDSTLFPNATSIKSIFRDLNGNIIAAFNHAGRSVVGKWDGTNWSELGSINSLGATNDINTVCADVYSNIYAAGNFTNSGGSYYVAKYGCIAFVTPSVTISTNSTSSCAGSYITITATGVNPGSSPMYTFYVNNVLLQQTSSNIFYDNTFMNNDSIFCELNANNTCATLYIATSNTIKLTRNQASTFTDNQTICNNSSYTFNGQSLTQSGIYLDTLVNSMACDSFITLNLTVLPQSTGFDFQTICSGSAYTFNGHALTTGGTYKDTLVNHIGCDSILTLYLTVNPISTNTINQTICNGNSVVFNGNTLTTSGNYNDTLVNYLGCDSILTLHLIVNQKSTNTISQSICNGNSVVFNGNTLTTSGNYNDTLVNYLGCDSILTLHLIVNQKSTHSINQSICHGKSVVFNNHTLAASGSYNDTLVNFNGCDSIITLNLTVLPALNNAVLQNNTTLTAVENSTGTTYQWLDCNNSNSAIAGETNQSYQTISNGNYAVEITNNGCKDTSICTAINLSCIAHFNTAYDTALNTFTLTVDSITAVQAISYSWNFGDGTTSTLAAPSHNFANDTTYAVCLQIQTASSNTCSYCHTIGKDYQGHIIKSAGFLMNVKNKYAKPNGLSMATQNNAMQVFPNPSNNHITIQLPNQVNNATLKLINVLGETLFEKTNQSGNLFKIDISQYNDGIYMIQLEEQNKIWRSKIIKQ
ncbi:MAG: hypothetical protein RJA07_699 [Bacteroidota bacterium]|jgi:hypothetical protein